MATPNISMNPILTTNAAGLFATTWAGLMQGTYFDDPAVRFALAGGYLDNAETIPMWGGVGISEYVPGAASTPPTSQGGPIKRATQINVTASSAQSGDLTGFSVFNQAHNMINSPQSPVPLSGGYMGVNFFRLGSGARIALQIDPGLVSLDGSIITKQTSWDFSQQRIVGYSAAYAAVTIASAAAWSAGTVVLTLSGSRVIAPGTYVNITGATPSTYNGTWPVTANSGTSLTIGMTADPGAYVSGGTVGAGGGLLPVRILRVETGSMIVSYDSTTGFATWNRSGACAVALI